MHKIIDLNLFGELLSELAKHGDANADETFRRYARRQFGLECGILLVLHGEQPFL